MRSVLIPYDEIVDGIIKATLRPYIGVVVEVCDLVPLLESIMDRYFYCPADLPGYTPKDLMRNFGVPTDVADVMIAKVLSDVGLSVQSALGLVYPGRTYRHHVVEGLHIQILEYES